MNPVLYLFDGTESKKTPPKWNNLNLCLDVNSQPRHMYLIVYRFISNWIFSPYVHQFGGRCNELDILNHFTMASILVSKQQPKQPYNRVPLVFPCYFESKAWYEQPDETNNIVKEFNLLACFTSHYSIEITNISLKCPLCLFVVVYMITYHVLLYAMDITVQLNKVGIWHPLFLSFSGL